MALTLPEELLVNIDRGGRGGQLNNQRCSGLFKYLNILEYSSIFKYLNILEYHWMVNDIQGGHTYAAHLTHVE